MVGARARVKSTARGSQLGPVFYHSKYVLVHMGTSFMDRCYPNTSAKNIFEWKMLFLGEVMTKTKCCNILEST